MFSIDLQMAAVPVPIYQPFGDSSYSSNSERLSSLQVITPVSLVYQPSDSFLLQGWQKTDTSHI